MIRLNKTLYHKKFRLLTLVLILMGQGAFSQSKVIQGTIKSDDEGDPLPGVTVILKGTTTGAVSDVDGQYSIDIGNAQNPILVFSFLGYKSKEVAVKGQSQINPILEIDVSSLEEVVVIGYGSQKKKVVTAATVKVTGEKLEKRLSTTALQAMQGQAAGVSIRSNSGQPGEGMKVVIRGVGTINNSDPIYIVDGLQVGDIKYLNNADIESIDVLKDAASAAIYGARGANGVVLVTTKKGRPGKATLSFDAFYGLQNNAKKADLLNADQYARIMNEQHLNSGGSPGNLPFDLNNMPVYTEQGSANNDWLDEMFEENAVTQNYTVGLSGGSEASNYSVSVSYTGQDGIVGGANVSNYNRLGGRVNSEHKLYDGFLTIGENLTLTNVDRQGIAVGNQYFNTLRGAFGVSPLLPMYDDNGQFFDTSDKTIFNQFDENYFNDTESNPYASMLYNNQNRTSEYKLVGNAFAEIKPIRNLKIRSSFGFEFYSEENRSYTPIYSLSIYNFNVTDDVSQGMRRSRVYQFDNYATYDFSFDDHSFTAMLGTSYRNYQGSWIQGGNSVLAFNDFDRAWLNNATNETVPELSASGAPDVEDVLLSYFGRLQYNFKERYLLSATFRADGSSKFAEGNQWGYFPSVSAGWVLSEEAFLQSSSFINFVKLRASWGQNGSQAIDNFQFVGPIEFSNATYAFGSEEGVNTPGSYQSRLANEDIKWETSEQINIGTDVRFMANKFLVALDWYQKSTVDWLVRAPILATAGAQPPFINGGKIVNTGIEWELTYQDSFGEFEYSIGVNGAYNDNVVKDIPTEDGIVHGSSNSLFANSPEFYQARTGHPIGFFWGFESDGLFQNLGEVDTHRNSEGSLIQPSAAPGDVRFIDQNDDGLLTDEDKIQLGNPNPPWSFGLNFSGDYRGFDLSFMCYGVAGNDIVQSYRDHGSRYANYTTAVMDRWTGEGTSNTIPRVTNGNINYSRFSSLFIQDGSYLRIGNVTLGYDFSELINSENIGQMRLYVAVNNLHTFTKYDGMDPDIGWGLDNGSTDRFSSGIDLGFYPNPRTFLVGISAKF